MSKYNEYARRLDAIAQEAFKDFITAADRYQEAKDKEASIPKGFNGVMPKYAADHAQAKGEVEKARKDYQEARRRYDSSIFKVRELRKELEEAVTKDYMANPSGLDANTMELLKAGILNPGEYANLMNGAEEAENFTLVRIIANYAEEEAKKAQANGRRDTANELRRIALYGRNCNGGEVLGKFDELTRVYEHIVQSNRVASINTWDKVTREEIENF